MRGMLEEIDDEDRGINFLRHLLISSRRFTRADDVYSTVQLSVRGETSAVSFLSDLERYSRLYVATYRADAEQWATYPKSATQALIVLNKYDIKPLRPLIFAIAKSFQPKESANALRFLVSFATRLLIASTTRSGSIEESIAASALGVWDGRIEDTNALKISMSKIVPDDVTFREAFATASSSKPDLARYYLRSLESVIDQQDEPWMLVNDDPAVITLEHILPKSPRTHEWPEFESESISRYIRRLGNMCLLQRTPNSNARSDRFEDKLVAYRSAPLSLTASVAENEHWSPDVINQRQAAMADLAVKAWPI